MLVPILEKLKHHTVKEPLGDPHASTVRKDRSDRKAALAAQGHPNIDGSSCKESPEAAPAADSATAGAQSLGIIDPAATDLPSQIAAATCDQKSLDFESETDEIVALNPLGAAPSQIAAAECDQKSLQAECETNECCT